MSAWGLAGYSKRSSFCTPGWQPGRRLAPATTHHPGQDEPRQWLLCPNQQPKASVDEDLRQVVRAGHQLKQAACTEKGMVGVAGSELGVGCTGGQAWWG